MSIRDSADLYAKALVAQYLADNGHKATLDSFLVDCGLSMSDVRDIRKAYSDDLETIVSERIMYAEETKHLVLNVGLEKKMLKSGLEAPSWNHDLKFELGPLKMEEGRLAISASFCDRDELLISFADRKTSVYQSNWQLVDNNFLSGENLGVVKLCGKFPGTCIYYMCGQDGSFRLEEIRAGLMNRHIVTTKIHQRMMTHMRLIGGSSSKAYTVSFGLDNYLRVHEVDLYYPGSGLKLVSEIKLESACTSLQVALWSGKLVIFVTRADYTHLLCYNVELQLLYKIALNNAQFSTYSFNIRDMAFIGRRDSYGIPLVDETSMLLIATSHIPYMRLLAVELPHETVKDNDSVFYDKVLKNMPTEIEQDSYSEPILKVLPNCNGVLVGDTAGLYAIDVVNEDSWLLDLPELHQGVRVKCMDINEAGTKLVLGLADKSVSAYNIVV